MMDHEVQQMRFGMKGGCLSRGITIGKSGLILVAISVILSTSACLSKQQRDDKLDDLALATPKPGNKAQPPAQAPAVAVTPATPTGPSMDLQIGLYRRLLDPGQTFSDADRQLFSSLPLNPPAGSVTEAVLVLGIAKTALSPRVPPAPTFQESDLVKTGPEHPTSVRPVLSLEQLCADHGVNLPEALRQNPWLASPQVATMLLAAQNAAPSSAQFSTAVQAALRQQLAAWQQLGSTLPADMQPVASGSASAGVVGPPVSAQLPGPPASAAVPPVPVLGIPAPMAMVGENNLDQAQVLADKGDYRAAVQRAGMVNSTSPAYSKAQEKIREFSNLGVQELRRKAAAAFQTAMPISDPKVRALYLKQAKSYLEDAISSFPEATQLPTVRENLRVIAKDLEKLST